MPVVVQNHFVQYFSYTEEVSFIDAGNQGTWRKPQSCRKLLTFYHLKFYRVHFTTAGVELTTNL